MLDLVHASEHRLKPQLALASLLLSLSVGGCSFTGANQATSQTSNDRELLIWWSEGYYPEETDAIESITRKWEKATGNKVKLVFFNDGEISQRATEILNGGPKPDLMYGYSVGDSHGPTFAYKGFLLKTDDIIKEFKNDYSPGIIENITYLNKDTRKRFPFSVPLSVSSAYIHYWKDLLQEANETDLVITIPDTWNEFWEFWGINQQKAIQAGFVDIKGIGLPMASSTSDTHILFDFFLEAHEAKIISQSGELLLTKPEERKKVIQAMKNYTSFYKKGWVPSKATEWGDVDNNINFLSSLSLMTANPTLSIPGSQTADEVAYYERIASVGWPKGLNGKTVRTDISVKQMFIFNGNKTKEAKSYARNLIKPENLSIYVEGSQGRYLPVSKNILENPFWNELRNTHIQASRETVENYKLAYQIYNPAYTEVRRQNIWAQAIEQVCVNNVPVDIAVDNAIESIESIFKKWERS